MMMSERKIKIIIINLDPHFTTLLGYFLTIAQEHLTKRCLNDFLLLTHDPSLLTREESL
jgi:hypothetical protein